LLRVFACLASVVVFVGPLTARAQGAREYLNTPVNQWSGYVELMFTRAESAASADLPLPNDLAVSRVTVPYVLYSFPWRKKYAGVSLAAPFTRVSAANGALQTYGFSDPGIGFHANLRGLPALRKDELAKYVPRTIVSLHLTVNVPVGKYDPNSEVNTGANRWAFTPLVNVDIPMKKGKAWLDLYASGRFFTNNNQFQGNKTLSQNPLFTFSGHFSHDLGKRYWVAAGSNYDIGGASSIDHIQQHNGVNGFRPRVAISGRFGGIRLTLSYENTKTTEKASSRNGLLGIRVAFLIF
jgi:hypothetical protein